MTTNQDLFMNGINQSISNLIKGAQPEKDPGKTAYTWFNAQDTAQPSQVDSFMELEINSETISTEDYTPANNWASWSSAMNAAFANATGTVAQWLNTVYATQKRDLPTVPDDVIAWTKQNLPANAGAVVGTYRAVKRSS